MLALDLWPCRCKWWGNLNFFFFFVISNKDLLISKKETPKYTRSIQGCTYQIQKLHKSSKSKIEEKGWFLHTENQSNKILKKKKLEIRHRMLIVFKTPTISLLPNTPHQTMRNNNPYISIMMVTKSTLLASKELNNRHWHNPTNSK